MGGSLLLAREVLAPEQTFDEQKDGDDDDDDEEHDYYYDDDDDDDDDRGIRFLIHWKGEDRKEYSIQFRRIEFCGALSAVLASGEDNRNKYETLPSIRFRNALKYAGPMENMPEVKLIRYNEAMQYVVVPTASRTIPSCSSSSAAAALEDVISKVDLVRAAERCSLVHALYEIVAVGGSYEELSGRALATGGFDDMRPGRDNESATWCVRVRRYYVQEQPAVAEGGGLDDSSNSGAGAGRRHGARTRSMTSEEDALRALEPLLLTFGGRVDLENPDCKIYIFDGLVVAHGNGSSSDTARKKKVVLARRIAKGPRVTSIAPNTRLCRTNTPLDPVAAYCLCNVAQVRDGHAILDPYAGSCSTLLAVAAMSPACRTVGIEIANDRIVNRTEVRRDFSIRGLRQPSALICGDSNSPEVRAEARRAVGDQPFDAIVTDPPYGIRESTATAGAATRANNDQSSSSSFSPLDDLLTAVRDDRAAGRPLLKKGGRLVCFVPLRDDERLEEALPKSWQLRAAGLRCDVVREQPLNDRLSRWLVSLVCLR